MLHADVTDRVLKAFYHVYNTLGYGFLEKVYQNALVLALRKAGVKVEAQVPIKVYFEGEVVGDYFADVLVVDCVLLELKAADAICEKHESQLLNYLKATDVEVGLVLNFGPKPEFHRKVFTNDRKNRTAN
jgi:GxxExxY protein